MKTLLIALFAACACASLHAQTFTWQPSPGQTQVPIWPGAAPDAQPVAGPEFAVTTGKDPLVAGRPWIAVENVSQATMTVYSPRGKNTGAAVGGRRSLPSARTRFRGDRPFGGHVCNVPTV